MKPINEYDRPTIFKVVDGLAFVIVLLFMVILAVAVL